MVKLISFVELVLRFAGSSVAFGSPDNFLVVMLNYASRFILT
jgi:hypothetical protein